MRHESFMDKPMITVTGIEEVQKAIKQAKFEMRVNVWKEMQSAGLNIQREARKRLRGNKQGRDTGALAANIKVYEKPANLEVFVGVKEGTGRYAQTNPGGSAAGIGASIADVAKWVEYGTGIYGPNKSPIVPKRAKILSWIHRKGGHPQGGPIFAKSVKGRAPTPFLIPSGEEERPKFLDRIRRVLGLIGHG